MGEQHFIGFLGAGKMASALAGGFLRAGLASADSIVASDPFVPGAEDSIGDIIPKNFSKNLFSGISLYAKQQKEFLYYHSYANWK